MKTFLLLWLMLFACSPVLAETAANVEPMADEEFMKILETYPITLSADEKQAVLETIAELPADDNAELKEFRDKLHDPAATVPFKAFLVFTTTQDGTAVHAELVDHADPLIQFVANLQLSGSGDTAAAQRLYDLIHNEDLTHEQKQWLATWCRGVGIHVKTDTADSIFEHLRTVMNHEPKFKPGDAAPDFEAKDVAGKTWSLKKLAGRFVVLHFWATDCGPCMGEMDMLKELLGGYSPLQVEIIFVSLDSDRQKFDEVLKKLELPFHQVFDGAGWGGKLARTFGVNSMPSNVIIDGKGIVRSTDIFELPALVAGVMGEGTTNQTNSKNQKEEGNVNARREDGTTEGR